MEPEGLFVDTSAFVLLAGADLFEPAVEILGLGLENVRRLHAIEAQLTRGRAFKERYSDAVRSAALGLCARVAPVDTAPDPDLLERLVNVPRIDDGEAVLFGLVAERGGFCLLSDDKASMIALASDPEVRDIRDRVAGRVITLETVIELLVEHDGAEQVAQKINTVREANTMLRVVFSRGAHTTAELCREGLRAYLDDLGHHLGEDFLYRPVPK